MTQKECYDLIGLKATDPKLLEFFEKYNLGKVPKIGNTSIMHTGKTIEDKERNIIFNFNLDLTHDRFYPPVSPKNDNYNFNLYLHKVSICRDYPKKKLYLKDADFFDVTPPLDAKYNSLIEFYGEPNRYIKVTFSKDIDDLRSLTAFYKPDKDFCSDIVCQIITHAEFLSHYAFNQNEQTYAQDEILNCMLIKWLYDKGYLKLSKDAYAENLQNTKESICDFVYRNLKGHLWDNQITDTPLLRSYPFSLINNTGVIKNEAEEVVSFFYKPIILKLLGVFNEYDALYKQEEINALLLKITWQEKVFKKFAQTMDENYELFKKLKALPVNQEDWS